MQIISIQVDFNNPDVVVHHLVVLRKGKVRHYRRYYYGQANEEDDKDSKWWFYFDMKLREWILVLKFDVEEIEKLERMFDDHIAFVVDEINGREYEQQIEYAIAQGGVLRKRRQALEKINK